MDLLTNTNKTSDIKKYHKEYRIENLEKYKERDLLRYWKNKLANKQIDINTIQTENLSFNDTIQLYKATFLKHNMLNINPEILKRIENY